MVREIQAGTHTKPAFIRSTLSFMVFVVTLLKRRHSSLALAALLMFLIYIREKFEAVCCLVLFCFSTSTQASVIWEKEKIICFPQIVF